MNKRIVLSEEVTSKVIEMYKEQPSLRRIQKELSLTQQVVKRTLTENNVPLLLDKREKAINRGFKPNQNAFLDFTEEETLYYYGLLLADGNLHKNTLSIILKHSDKDILEKLAKYFGENYEVKDKVSNGFKQARLSISYYKINERIIQQGFEPAKSLKEKLPKCYDDSYNMRHFWRGFIDGDGTVKFVNNIRDIRLLGSKEIVTEFAKFVSKHSNCIYKDPYEDKKVKGCYRVSYNGKYASDVAYLLYNESNISLSRKYNHAMELIKFIGITSTNFNVASKRNALGICGVTEYKREDNLVGYKVTWVDSVKKKQFKKSFKFKEYGEDALAEAIKFRQEMNEIHYNN